MIESKFLNLITKKTKQTYFTCNKFLTVKIGQKYLLFLYTDLNAVQSHHAKGQACRISVSHMRKHLKQVGACILAIALNRERINTGKT